MKKKAGKSKIIEKISKTVIEQSGLKTSMLFIPRGTTAFNVKFNAIHSSLTVQGVLNGFLI